MTYEEQLQCLKEKIESYDAILVGAASGMSAAAGYTHYYERSEEFVQWFGEFEKKYGFHCSFDGAYYRYPSTEARWAYMARLTTCIYNEPLGTPYQHLAKLLEGKNFHILTTNQDGQFNYLYPEEKISAIQGDWKFLQCSRRCKDELYPAQQLLQSLNEKIKPDLTIESSDIPRCPHCGSELEAWVRSPIFLEGSRYRREHRKVQAFLAQNQNKKLLLLELGVGRMTPMFIQEPFWALTQMLPQAFYVNINPKHALMPVQIEHKGMTIKEDIAKVFADLLGGK